MDENPLENVTLIHNVPTRMKNYTVTYEGDSSIEKNDRVFFKIHFKSLDTASGKNRKNFMYIPTHFW
jgi:hypothetical protein